MSHISSNIVVNKINSVYYNDFGDKRQKLLQYEKFKIAMIYLLISILQA